MSLARSPAASASWHARRACSRARRDVAREHRHLGRQLMGLGGAYVRRSCLGDRLLHSSRARAAVSSPSPGQLQQDAGARRPRGQLRRAAARGVAGSGGVAVTHLVGGRVQVALWRSASASPAASAQIACSASSAAAPIAPRRRRIARRHLGARRRPRPMALTRPAPGVGHAPHRRQLGQPRVKRASRSRSEPGADAATRRVGVRSGVRSRR